jgi:hypothetical protein
MTDEIPLFPVAAMTVGPVPRMEIVVIRFDFLTGPMQPPEQANPGRHYAMTPQQARELAQRIADSLRQLENAGPAVPPGPRQ